LLLLLFIWNLFGRSYGRWLLSLRRGGGVESWITCWLVCILIRDLYFKLSRLISSWTVGICRSCLISALGTYQGASVRRRRALDWNRSRMAILVFEAEPHSCIPYVHTGLMMILYIRSLLFKFNLDLRPSSQWSLVSRMPSCLRFLKIWFDHVRWWSRSSLYELVSSVCSPFPWETRSLSYAVSHNSQSYQDSTFMGMAFKDK
jgi:hypothetical protein